MSDRDLISVLTTLDETLIAVASTVLEQAEIPFLVRGRDEAGLENLVNRVSGLFSRRPVGMHILVPLDFEEEARSLLTPGEDSFEEIEELSGRRES